MRFATALDAGGGKNLEILGADVAGQCLRRGLVDEILVYVLPVLLGDGSPGVRFLGLPVSAYAPGACHYRCPGQGPGAGLRERDDRRVALEGLQLHVVRPVRQQQRGTLGA